MRDQVDAGAVVTAAARAARRRRAAPRLIPTAEGAGWGSARRSMHGCRLEHAAAATQKYPSASPYNLKVNVISHPEVLKLCPMLLLGTVGNQSVALDLREFRIYSSLRTVPLWFQPKCKHVSIWFT